MMEVVKEKVELRRYPEYKDSGVEWLGEIPKHWRIEKGKWQFNEENRPTREEDEVVTCFRDGEVTLRANRRTDGFTNSLKEHGYQGIRKGDLVIHNMDAFAGAIGVSDSDGKSTPVYSVCTPKYQNEANQYYYAYFLRDLALNGFIESLAKGIRERSTDFRFNDFGKLLLTLPPYEEQTAIANFLDRKTEQIDQLIEIKQKQIELLKEKRQILIQKAVTRGLNSDVPLKSSGVDWIGDIPEHWEVKKLKYLIKSTAGYAFPSNEFTDKGIPVIRISDVNQDGTVHLDKAPKLSREYEKYLSDYGLKYGDILMAMTGGTIGKTSIYSSNQKALLNQRVCYFRIKDKVTRELFYLWTKTAYWKNFIDLNSSGGAQPNISDKDILELPIVISSLKGEIQDIVEFLVSVEKKFENAVKLFESQVVDLKEYKTTLINSAVTGKIKVN